MRKPTLAMGLVKHNGKILIIERANKEPGMSWAFPGGEVEPGETPDHTAQREVFEETGVKCQNCRLIHERIHPITKHHILYFACEAVTVETKTNESDEIASVEWVEPEEALRRFTSEPAPEVITYMLEI